MDRALYGRWYADPRIRLLDLSGGPEHAAGGARPRSRCHLDDALSELREGGRGCSRLAGGRALVCAVADWVSDGPIRAGAPCPYQGCRLRRPVGSAVPRSITVARIVTKPEAGYAPHADRGQQRCRAVGFRRSVRG